MGYPMKNVKRIVALCGVIILVGLYITTFIAALFQTEFSSQLFLASLYSTFIIPIMIYAYMLVYKVVKGDKKNDSDEKE